MSYPLFLSLSPPTPMGLSLDQSFPLLCLSGLGPAGFIRGLLHSTLPGFVCCTFFDCFMWSAVHPWTLTHIFLAFLQPCNWLLIKQSMCPLYSFPFFFKKKIFVFAASFWGSNCLQSLGGNEFYALLKKTVLSQFERISKVKHNPFGVERTEFNIFGTFIQGEIYFHELL